MQSSNMAREAAQSPELIAEQLSGNFDVCQSLAECFRSKPPKAVMMVGRGTSDHAGVYAKYLIEVTLGIPVISAAPSISGVFNATLNLEGCIVIAISQSGKSPDLLNQVKMAKKGGAYCIAMVNCEDSPLAELVDTVIPLCAGDETAVAATKSYLASLAAICQLIAIWKKDVQFMEGLTTLPYELKDACKAEQRLTTDALKDVAHCVVVGRGFGYAIAREVALKMKEVLGLHAEAFSSAEFLHGPVTLLEKRLVVINVTINDESYKHHIGQLLDLKNRGGRIIDISLGGHVHPRLQALAIMQRFYLDIEIIARERGLDPDVPPGLKKVTETV